MEKPLGSQLGDIALSGGQWNALVLIANVQTLWEAGRQCIPEVVMPLEQPAGGIGTSSEQQRLLHLYRTMPTRNFSSDLLTLIPQQLHMMELTGVYWSDWGRPERIHETVAFMGRRDPSGTNGESADPAWIGSRLTDTVQEGLTVVIG